ncbi:MAG: hypothetical protein IH988_01995 [Planctomycetes bacterium]|nr:hypothetical protein [Planctomycetota bacterium]
MTNIENVTGCTQGDTLTGEIIGDQPTTPVDAEDLDVIADVDAGGDEKQDDEVSATSDPAPIDWTDVTELDVMDPMEDVSESVEFDDESEGFSDEPERAEGTFTVDDPVQREFQTAEQGEFADVPAAVGTPASMIEFDTGNAKFDDVLDEVAFKNDPYAAELRTGDALVHRAAPTAAGHSAVQAQEDLNPLAFPGDGSGRHDADATGDTTDRLSTGPEWSSGRSGGDTDEAASARTGSFFAPLWGAVRSTGGLARRADNDSTSEHRGNRRS